VAVTFVCCTFVSALSPRSYCKFDDECMNLLKASINEMGHSARARDKILLVACTAADLDEGPVM
jgi:predicted ATPase with chaperone activity